MQICIPWCTSAEIVWGFVPPRREWMGIKLKSTTQHHSADFREMGVAPPGWNSREGVSGGGGDGEWVTGVHLTMAATFWMGGWGGKSIGKQGKDILDATSGEGWTMTYHATPWIAWIVCPLCPTSMKANKKFWVIFTIFLPKTPNIPFQTNATSGSK